MSEVLEGSVKWFNEDKGYGFITVAGADRDVFVHINQLRKSGIDRSLAEGEKVSFVIGQGTKGKFATNITLNGGEGAQG